MNRSTDAKRSSPVRIGLLAPMFCLAACGVSAVGSDYPQWRGQNRDGISADTGLLKQWPEGGPKVAWKATGLGEGHSTVSIARGKVFGMGLRGQDEVVWALDEKTGRELWSRKIADGIRLGGPQGGYGPRCVPTFDNGRLYVLGVGGELACLDAESGSILWHKSLTQAFGAEVPTWGYSESPLVDGDKVVVSPGGSKATVVAFNKSTGEPVWTCMTSEGDRAHYASAIAADVNGQREYITLLSNGVVGISATTGKELWRYDKPANHTANCPTPIYKDGYVFAASGYQTGGGLAKLNGSSAQEVYFTHDNMQNHHGGVILVGDYLYGYNDAGRALTCLEFKTGKVMWTNPSVGKGSLAYADGHLILRSENARKPLIALIAASPDGYVEHGRFEQPEPSGQPTWPYPIVANGKLYIRDMDKLFVYDIHQ